MTLKTQSTIDEKALEAHKKLQGKIGTYAKDKLDTREAMSVYYTPGVGTMASYLAKNKSLIRDYTIKNNSVAVISDGSAVLGLGNIGPEGALPVMEGKAMIFSEFAQIDAFPVILATQDTEEIIKTVVNIAPSFGGINLEDIAAPACFEIEKRLIELLDIPVMHDDQHGTAIVVLAALINSLKVANKKVGQVKVVIIGAGAAGSATARLLFEYGFGNIVLVDSHGILNKKRKNLDTNKQSFSSNKQSFSSNKQSFSSNKQSFSSNKQDLVSFTNKEQLEGDLKHALFGADVVVGLSTGGRGKITASMIRSMANKPIVLALANPNPEIVPSEALKAGAFIAGCGRSDYPNQVNNFLVFPGVFRGALDHRVTKITTKMKLNVAKTLASIVKNPTVDNILPSILDKSIVGKIASSIAN